MRVMNYPKYMINTRDEIHLCVRIIFFYFETFVKKF